MYMLPSDKNLRIGKVKNYNNTILLSSPSFKIGTNLKINLDEEKDKPDVKPKGEEKIKSEPDIKSNRLSLDSDTERSRFEALSFLVIRNGE